MEINLSQLIIEEMRTQGISYREFARRIGCSKATIEYWKNGDRNLSVAMADRALRELGISITIGKEHTVDKGRDTNGINDTVRNRGGKHVENQNRNHAAAPGVG